MNDGSQGDSAPTQSALQKEREEQAAERLKAAMRIEAPEPEIIHRPVFAPGDIAKLETALHAVRETVYTLEGIVTTIHSALREADRLSARANQSYDRTPTATEDGRPTATSQGPMKLLRLLNELHPEWTTAATLAELAKFSGSTVRTYLPILRGGKLIDAQREGSGAIHYRITDAGTVLCTQTQD